MRNVWLLAGLCLVALCAAVGAGATTSSYSDSVALNATNWSSEVTLPKFNVPGETLYSVTLTFVGTVEGAVRLESYDSSATTVTTTLSADLQLWWNGNQLLSVQPHYDTSDNLTAHDGEFDWGGTSGRTYSDIKESATGSWSSWATGDLAAFTGSGNITMPVYAFGHSTGTGSGNLALFFSTLASADVTVTYNYGNVPEPPAIMALLSGLAGVSGYIGRRRKQLS